VRELTLTKEHGKFMEGFAVVRGFGQ